MTLFLPFIALLAFFPTAAFADGPGAPLYLFTDMRYWVFFIVYAGITIGLIVWVRAAAALRDKRKPFPLHDLSFGAAFMFLIGLMYQIAHHTEHITQVFQWWYLGLANTSSKGIIFFADLEWNHFIFDSGYFLLMTFATFLFLRLWWKRGHTVGKLGTFLLTSAIITQFWHAFEHTVRIVRHVDTGCEPCRGVVDAVFHVQLIPLHFWYNTLVLTFPLLAFFWFRMDVKLIQSAKAIAKTLAKTHTPSTDGKKS